MFRQFCLREIKSCEKEEEKNKNKYENNLKKAKKGDKKAQYIVAICTNMEKLYQEV